MLEDITNFIRSLFDGQRNVGRFKDKATRPISEGARQAAVAFVERRQAERLRATAESPPPPGAEGVTINAFDTFLRSFEAKAKTLEYDGSGAAATRDLFSTRPAEEAQGLKSDKSNSHTNRGQPMGDRYLQRHSIALTILMFGAWNFIDIYHVYWMEGDNPTVIEATRTMNIMALDAFSMIALFMVIWVANTDGRIGRLLRRPLGQFCFWMILGRFVDGDLVTSRLFLYAPTTFQLTLPITMAVSGLALLIAVTAAMTILSLDHSSIWSIGRTLDVLRERQESFFPKWSAKPSVRVAAAEPDIIESGGPTPPVGPPGRY